MQDVAPVIRRVTKTSGVTDAAAVKRSLRVATRWLGKHAAQIDQINVYSKPDRDTGSNMLATMRAALWEADRRPAESVSALAKALAHGALMGARGDSGVILAQFLGGVARALDDCQVLDAGRLAAALAAASNSSWQGLVKPAAGTILTACEDCARAAVVASDNAATLEDMLEVATLAAQESVARTRTQLPVLREAGVVDAGAMGFAVLVEGLWRACGGRGIQRFATKSAIRPVETPAQAVVAVASGAGLANLFKQIGASQVVHGGQTMNPSAAELLDAIEATGHPKVIVLPNNRNVILAARQAAELAGQEVAVVPSATMPQGIAALRAFARHLDMDSNLEAMAAAAQRVRTIEITRAVRAVRLGDLDVREGDVIGLLDDRLAASGAEDEAVALRALDLARTAAHRLLTIYPGLGVPAERAKPLATSIRRRYPTLQVIFAAGGQPHYSYILALE